MKYLADNSRSRERVGSGTDIFSGDTMDDKRVLKLLSAFLRHGPMERGDTAIVVGGVRA